MPTINLKRLITQLNTTGLQQSNNGLYQVIRQLIDTLKLVIDTGGGPNAGGGNGGGVSALLTKSYLTSDDETGTLPNSKQLLAGAGIIFDDSIAGERTLISTSGLYYDSPLTDGDPDETDLIFADGECIIAQVPV